MRLWRRRTPPPLRAREAINAAGKKKPARINIPKYLPHHHHRLSLAVVEHVARAQRLASTHRLLGADLVTPLPGCGPLQIT